MVQVVPTCSAALRVTQCAQIRTTRSQSGGQRRDAAGQSRVPVETGRSALLTGATIVFGAMAAEATSRRRVGGGASGPVLPAAVTLPRCWTAASRMQSSRLCAVQV